MRGIVIAALLATACGAPARPPASASVSPSAPGPSELRFTDAQSGGVFFAVLADGTLRVGKQDLGHLTTTPAILFTFAPAYHGATARLTADGHVVLEAPPAALATLPGDLGKLLRDYDGKVSSAYVIDADARATAPHASPLTFDDAGHLTGTSLSVPGLAAPDRRAAMFVYVLLSMIIA